MGQILDVCATTSAGTTCSSSSTPATTPRRLKTLHGLTPYQFICKTWTEQPSRLTADPAHYTLGPNI
jgi:hypothetical protein